MQASAEACAVDQAFEQFQIWYDGKNQKQDDEKVFTVRFTVKTIRLEAMDVDRQR
jgi:hypothetical protein